MRGTVKYLVSLEFTFNTIFFSLKIVMHKFLNYKNLQSFLITKLLSLEGNVIKSNRNIFWEIF